MGRFSKLHWCTFNIQVIEETLPKPLELSSRDFHRNQALNIYTLNSNIISL